MNDLILQAHQFFRSRVARSEDYEKRHKNGHAASDTTPEDDEDTPTVREISAHKNVFHRP